MKKRFLENQIKFIISRLIGIEDKHKIRLRNLLIRLEELVMPVDLHKRFWTSSYISHKDLSPKRFLILTTLDGLVCILEMTFDDENKTMFLMI